MRKTRKIVRLECHKKRAFALFATKMTRFPSAKCLFLPSRQPLGRHPLLINEAINFQRTGSSLVTVNAIKKTFFFHFLL